MPITELVSHKDVRSCAKIPSGILRALVVNGKVHGKRKEPLSLSRIFYEEVESQTVEQGGIDKILYYEEAADLINQATDSNLRKNKLKEIVGDGLHLGKRLVDSYLYWEDIGGRVRIKKEAIFRYQWKGKNIVSKLLRTEAVEELINIIKRYKPDIDRPVTTRLKQPSHVTSGETDLLYIDPIYINDLSKYLARYPRSNNAPVRVFFPDGPPRLMGRDGFLHSEANRFIVKWHSFISASSEYLSGDSTRYTIQEGDIIGIEEPPRIGYRHRRFVSAKRPGD